MLFSPNQSNSRQFNPKLSKSYLTAYKKYAKQKKYNLKRFNFWLVGSEISGDAVQTQFYFNKGIQTIGGVRINIELYTIENFINLLLQNIDRKKWYVLTPPPSICLSKEKVELLVDNNLATVI